MIGCFMKARGRDEEKIDYYESCILCCIAYIMSGENAAYREWQRVRNRLWRSWLCIMRKANRRFKDICSSKQTTGRKTKIPSAK